MAKTLVSDVIVPGIYNAYVYNKTKELSNVINSGIAMSSPQLDALAANGGKFVDMPLWKDLSGADEVLSDSTALTPDKITADKQTGVRLVRGRAWESADLAGILSGSDPLGQFTTRVASYRARQEQKTLVSIINGLFGTSGALTASNSIDISGGTGDAAKIGASSMLDTKQLLGDAASDLTAVAMHSATYTALEKQNLIQFIPNSNGVVDFTCPALLVACLVPQLCFRIRGYHPLWPTFSGCSPNTTVITCRLFRVRSPLLTESRLISYRDWETDRKSTRLNSSHSGEPRMPSSA